MTPADFRQQFPEFACTTDFPDAQVEFWLGVAGAMLNAERWADLLDLGLCLFTAHHLATGQREMNAAAVGGALGAVTGPTASKSVDKVSVSYTTNALTFENAGFWNASLYGIRLMTFARYVGAGGVQL